MAKKWPEIKKFYPRNPQKYVGDVNKIEMRSSWEIKFAHYCDTNPSVVSWNSEGVRIPYWSVSDNKQRTYHVDFIAEIINKDGIKETFLIEIKPYSQTIKPEMKKGKRKETYLNEYKTYEVNMDKWRAANEYAKLRNWKFIVMTEEHLYGKQVKK
jgi:hypothetical protein